MDRLQCILHIYFICGLKQTVNSDKQCSGDTYDLINNNPGC